ncbi:MAG: hypothetical protein OXC91_14045, partial [Rhodobacteraceae bacterium]|nr:hypothetical protein [Paracoccaceae bacterium]
MSTKCLAERIPVEDCYLRAFGRAAYNFAYLEWGIIYLVEPVRPGFLSQASNLTSGQIAGRFSEAARSLPAEYTHKGNYKDYLTKPLWLP